MTKPSWVFAGRASTNVDAARCAAAIRGPGASVVVIDPEASKTSTVGTDAACGAGPGAGTLDALGPLAGDGAGAADPLVAVLHAAAVTARTDPRTATTARCQLTRSDMPPHATVRGAAG